MYYYSARVFDLDLLKKDCPGHWIMEDIIYKLRLIGVDFKFDNYKQLIITEQEINDDLISMAEKQGILLVQKQNVTSDIVYTKFKECLQGLIDESFRSEDFELVNILNDTFIHFEDKFNKYKT